MYCHVVNVLTCCKCTDMLSLYWHVVSIVTCLFSLYFGRRPSGDSRVRTRDNLSANHWAHLLFALLQVLRTSFWPASHWTPTVGTCWVPPRAPTPWPVCTDYGFSPSCGSSWHTRATWRVSAPSSTTWLSRMWVPNCCVLRASWALLRQEIWPNVVVDWLAFLLRKRNVKGLNLRPETR
jgi:hypothetical protein